VFPVHFHGLRLRCGVTLTSPTTSTAAQHPRVLTATSAGMTDAITTADWRASRDLLRTGTASSPGLNPFHQPLHHAFASLIDGAGMPVSSERPRDRRTASTSCGAARDGRTDGVRPLVHSAQTQFCCRERSSTLLTAYSKHRPPQLHVMCSLTNHS